MYSLDTAVPPPCECDGKVGRYKQDVRHDVSCRKFWKQTRLPKIHSWVVVGMCKIDVGLERLFQTAVCYLSGFWLGFCCTLHSLLNYRIKASRTHRSTLLSKCCQTMGSQTSPRKGLMQSASAISGSWATAFVLYCFSSKLSKSFGEVGVGLVSKLSLHALQTGLYCPNCYQQQSQLTCFTCFFHSARRHVYRTGKYTNGGRRLIFLQPFLIYTPQCFTHGIYSCSVKVNSIPSHGWSF